jgi:hypothetical protein
MTKAAKNKTLQLVEITAISLKFKMLKKLLNKRKTNS